MRMLCIVLVAIGLVVLAMFLPLWAPIGGSAKVVSPDGWAWQNPLPQGNRLMGVWGSSPSDVFAVGYGGTILHYDGNSWSPMSSGTTKRVGGVWGNSSTDVFAVGELGTILHYDGSSWSAMSTATTKGLWDVWGTSASDVFVVGDDGAILHYDGSAWSPMSSSTTLDLLGIWGTSASDVFAVGDNGAILHYDGSAWSAMSSGTTHYFEDVWGSSSSDVFAVGRTIMHYDGSSWSEMTSGTTLGLLGIWGSSPSDVFAFGIGGTVVHYNGSAWAPMSSGTTSWLVDAWGASPSDVFAVGWDGAIVYYDGSAWAPMSSGTTRILLDVWGASPSNVFAVGEAGTILHYDGSTWSEMSSGITDCLYGVWGTSSTDVFAVGETGTILHYDGSAWSPMSSGTTYWLYGVWGTSSSDVFAVGYDILATPLGTILHYDGSAWTPMGSGFPYEFRDVWGTSSSDVFAVGNGQTILHYDGSSWSPMSSGSGSWLFDLWGTSPSDVYAVGGWGGTILHYDGSAWTPMSSGTWEFLTGIWGTSSSDIFVVGTDILLHYDGSSWSPMNSGAATCLNDVWGTSPSDVFVVGNSGAILHYLEGTTCDLTVTSAGCCPISVEWNGTPHMVDAGDSDTFALDCGIYVTVTADDSDPCCVFDSWSDGGAQTHDVYMDGDKSVTATCDWLDSDLTVNSIGCCNVTVEGLNGPVNVPASQSKTFANIPCCTNVTVTAVTLDDCFCDDIALDGVSQGCDPVVFHMDGNDHVVDVCCVEQAPIPEPCCWCIYLAEWWGGEDLPAGDPHRREYHCLHCVEWMPPEHTEFLYDPLGMHVIPDPSFHQEVFFYAGPAPNGYGVAEWDTIPGLIRWNIIFGVMYLSGIGYWNSQIDLLNWKTRYDVWNMGGTITLYSCTLQIIPVSGNPGWPYAVGNSWINIDMSPISPPAASYHFVNATETVTTPLFPSGIECYRVESYSWIDVNGVDDDGDGAVDEDPFNQYDDDSDGLTDEDGGDGVPDPGELTPSSTDWWNNDYGCSIKKETYPGAMYMGWEHFYMLWYGTDPPFPPWGPTYNLTVDQSTSCCSVDVGAPVGATVAAGTNQTFTDLECEVVISVNADNSAPCCDFDQWTGNVANPGSASTSITMHGDETVTAECSEATHVPWDVNCDGNVNEEDMNLLYDHFGETGDPGWILEDVKEDGKIDVLDMILVGQHWTE